MAKIDFTNVAVDKFAESIYGAKEILPFPGVNYNDTINYRDLCFDCAAGFVDPANVDLFRNSQVGQRCHNGSIQQLMLSGKTSKPLMTMQNP